jgi:hypothetical protein
MKRQQVNKFTVQTPGALHTDTTRPSPKNTLRLLPLLTGPPITKPRRRRNGNKNREKEVVPPF